RDQCCGSDGAAAPRLHSVPHCEERGRTGDDGGAMGEERGGKGQQWGGGREGRDSGERQDRQWGGRGEGVPRAGFRRAQQGIIVSNILFARAVTERAQAAIEEA